MSSIPGFPRLNPGQTSLINPSTVSHGTAPRENSYPQTRTYRAENALVPASDLRSPRLLSTASVLALWVPQGSWAALHIQKIPEQPQKNQDLLLSVQGIPDTFQDFIWYQGEETDGGTRLFTYIPDIQRPQRDGSAMRQRDIVGFPNGSMLLRHAQPSDSGTYHVKVTINPSWTMRAKTEVQVAGECWVLGEKAGRLTHPEQLPCARPCANSSSVQRTSIERLCVPVPEGIYSPHVLANKASIG